MAIELNSVFVGFCGLGKNLQNCSDEKSLGCVADGHLKKKLLLSIWTWA